jgi:ferredoxin
MKVHVNSQVCAGFGVCLGLCPEVFELHDDGYAVVVVSDVPPELEDAVRQAVSQCPARAISLSDDPRSALNKAEC